MNRVTVFTPYDFGNTAIINHWMLERGCTNYAVDTRLHRSPKGIELWVSMPPEHVLDFLLSFDSRLVLHKKLNGNDMHVC
jgi:hypothetical protein